MAVQRWLILDADGVAQNVVMWDADADPDWSPPEGFTVVPDDGTTAVAPPPADPTPTPAPTPPTIEAKVDAVIAAVAALVDDRHADAVDALATVTTEGTPT
jgi:hypothetical protein